MTFTGQGLIRLDDQFFHAKGLSRRLSFQEKSDRLLGRAVETHQTAWPCLSRLYQTNFSLNLL